MTEQHWTVYDRDWNGDGAHDEVEGECAVFCFPALYGETAAAALARWVKAVSGGDEDAAGFYRSEAHQGYEVVEEGAPLGPFQLAVRFLRAEAHPGYSVAKASVYQLRTDSAVYEIKLDPQDCLYQEIQCSEQEVVGGA
jgi:hypothetical protein